MGDFKLWLIGGRRSIRQNVWCERVESQRCLIKRAVGFQSCCISLEGSQFWYRLLERTYCGALWFISDPADNSTTSVRSGAPDRRSEISGSLAAAQRGKRRSVLDHTVKPERLACAVFMNVAPRGGYPNLFCDVHSVHAHFAEIFRFGCEGKRCAAQFCVARRRRQQKRRCTQFPKAVLRALLRMVLALMDYRP